MTSADSDPRPGRRKAQAHRPRHGFGHGKTATRGSKGQHAGTGFSQKRGFEGGRCRCTGGFRSADHQHFQEAVCHCESRADRELEGDSFNADRLIELGVIKKTGDGLKILGTGTLTRKITVEAHQFSKSAMEIQKAGGVAQAIGGAASE